MNRSYEAVKLLGDLAGAAINLLAAVQHVSGIVGQAQDAGRDISDDEWVQIMSLDDTARARVEAALKKAAETA